MLDNHCCCFLLLLFLRNNDRFKNMAYEKFTILQQEAQSILPGGLDPAMGAPHNKQFGNLTARRSISKSQSGYSKISSLLCDCLKNNLIRFFCFSRSIQQWGRNICMGWNSGQHCWPSQCSRKLFVSKLFRRCRWWTSSDKWCEQARRWFEHA